MEEITIYVNQHSETFSLEPRKGFSPEKLSNPTNIPLKKVRGDEGYVWGYRVTTWIILPPGDKSLPAEEYMGVNALSYINPE